VQTTRENWVSSLTSIRENIADVIHFLLCVYGKRSKSEFNQNESA